MHQRPIGHGPNIDASKVVNYVLVTLHFPSSLLKAEFVGDNWYRLLTPPVRLPLKRNWQKVYTETITARWQR